MKQKHDSIRAKNSISHGQESNINNEKKESRG